MLLILVIFGKILVLSISGMEVVCFSYEFLKDSVVDIEDIEVEVYLRKVSFFLDYFVKEVNKFYKKMYSLGYFKLFFLLMKEYIEF